MSASKPLVSVIIPMFQAAGVIRRTLESVRAQTHEAIEVLVVDDGSNDDSSAIVDEFAAQDSRFRLIRQENGGVGAARNTAIRQARGKYIAPLDADDIWKPEKLSRQVESMERAGEQVGLVYCWSVHIDDQDRVISSQVPVFVHGKVRRALVYRNFLGNASVPLFRAAALEKVGLYLTRSEQGGAQGCEDWDLHLRIAEHFELRVVPEYLVGYRQTGSAMSVAADSMARSFDVILERARQRNRDLPVTVFNWASGHFNNYLSRKCYRWGDLSGCLRFARIAAQADPMVLFDSTLQSRAAKSIVRLITGTKPKPAKLTSLNGNTWPRATNGCAATKRALGRNVIFSRIHARRWASVQPADAR